VKAAPRRSRTAHGLARGCRVLGDEHGELAALDRRPPRHPTRRPDHLDYATLFAEDLEPFTCRCGTPACRGTIRGSDHLLPFVEDRYGEQCHMHLL